MLFEYRSVINGVGLYFVYRDNENEIKQEEKIVPVWSAARGSAGYSEIRTCLLIVDIIYF